MALRVMRLFLGPRVAMSLVRDASGNVREGTQSTHQTIPSLRIRQQRYGFPNLRAIFTDLKVVGEEHGEMSFRGPSSQRRVS